ncbi:DUF1254 domain-containing protein [Blastopirellula sp. JC732]|uniref:DUF1254 domain-containing protein n=1 Tax=Blastopirellula sediminis TaxID=2894196 RepID=A0A9X1ML26_9BACT|nr:DUF1254 domain-containing protein [Blastopirellula sediminis]MCC9608662.1 DUF1254 domain-containing protein [Blastopirellula sediminis]MCC9628561.1 DUF1254 domain-containing protein [Blastopirellula sediminis]
MPTRMLAFSLLLAVSCLAPGCHGLEEEKVISLPAESDNEAQMTVADKDAPPAATESVISDAEYREIAEEAFIYGFPMVMNYGVMNEYFLNPDSSQYKCPINQLFNTARVYTPKDTAVVTPNSDTPYSFICADLRAEPLVLTVPKIDPKRYFSFQLIDMYTFNYGYIGSRTTGNDGGTYMIAGPSWQGEKPEGIDKVFPCETDFSLAVIRTQLFDAADLENVKEVQAGYHAQPLSAFLKQPAPESAAKIDWPAVDEKAIKANPFAYLNFVLQLCPATGPAAAEKDLRAKFAKIGVEAGKPFDVDKLTDAQKESLAAAMKSGMEKIAARAGSFGKLINGWSIGAAFGDRDFFHGDWALRAAAAKAGIYGNDAIEATYPLAHSDAAGNPLDGSQHNYTLTFAKDEFPPVQAFWSITMYDGKTQLLIENPIDRYLINSPMLPNLQKNEDGSLTIYIQKDSPGKEKEPNWLPAPDGPIYMVMRLYWPKEMPPSILPPGEGSWQPPGIHPAD